ncbi:STAS domain-containing protein [Streptomyces bikiniensis]|uniref:STAS domain-containing protein n=1 Tax=Streptomyces bikiniensis TaxID=1896 RepID=UPI0004BF6ED6|nr:STAS domain-containing protein [Streptomyces bikiniensis]
MTSNDEAERIARLSAEHRVVDGVRITTLRGEIDYDEQDVLREALLPEGASALPVVADMSSVTFIDSSGINVLLRTSQQMARAHSRLSIATPTDAVRRVLVLTGTDTVIDCHATLEDALKS